MFVVPSAPKKQVKAEPFEFALDGKPYKMSALPDSQSAQELLDLAEQPPQVQASLLLRTFVQHLPKAAREGLQSREQIKDLFQAWQKHSNAGESSASAE